MKPEISMLVLQIRKAMAEETVTVTLPQNWLVPVLNALESAQAEVAAWKADGMPADREELQKLLNEAYRKGNQAAHDAHNGPIAQLSEARRVVPELTDDALDIACGPALDPMYGPDAIVYGMRMARREGYRKAWSDLASRIQ